MPLINVNLLHTTESGAGRIRHNLNLPLDKADDVVSWCKEAVRQADLIISKGKNWYVYQNGVAITINARSNTIITAHPINAKVRAMREPDHVCLPEFLYQAVFVPKGANPPPRSIINDPEMSLYIKGFGARRGDVGVVAEQNGQVVGAAWTRIIPSHGHVDSETPELAISLLPEFRGYGAGTKMMEKLFAVLRENGYAQTSLSVQKDNPALRFYERLGYKVKSDETNRGGHDGFIMIKELAKR
jgi:ribosomal protein S18 acetylase RimI-like enzyme